MIPSMFYQLPPAGNPVCVDVNTALALPPFLSTKDIRLYDSGTAALAVAIQVALRKVKKQKDVHLAEVILPAYACPDLVSAVIYNGARPVLVDLACDRPWLDLSKLTDVITENTIAIVAVNLFGISERWAQLHDVAKQKKVILIEDSAQYFPGIDEAPVWHGDLVVLSFGRGKPVSLFGGGAVISRNSELTGLLPDTTPEPSGMYQKLAFVLKARLYNAMISPYLYWLPQALPFLHLGETRYHTLHSVGAMGQLRSELLATNITSYQNDSTASLRCEMISSILESKESVSDLPRLCEVPVNRRLLRYPILVDKKLRNSIYRQLKQAGLGPSIMYPASLPKIASLKHLLDSEQQFSNADAFASRLLTLPSHSQVSEKDIEKMDAILKDV